MCANKAERCVAYRGSAALPVASDCAHCVGSRLSLSGSLHRGLTPAQDNKTGGRPISRAIPPGTQALLHSGFQAPSHTNITRTWKKNHSCHPPSSAQWTRRATYRTDEGHRGSGSSERSSGRVHCRRRTLGPQSCACKGPTGGLCRALLRPVCLFSVPPHSFRTQHPFHPPGHSHSEITRGVIPRGIE